MLNRETPLISIVIPSWFTNEQHGKYGLHETFWFATRCIEQLLKVTPRELIEIIIKATTNNRKVETEKVIKQ